MIKSLAIFVATIFFSFAQNYDPNTGELIKKEVYDPLTGELKKENKAQIKKRIELTTGEVILGYLINNNNDIAKNLFNLVRVINSPNSNFQKNIDYYLFYLNLALNFKPNFNEVLFFQAQIYQQLEYYLLWKRYPQL